MKQETHILDVVFEDMTDEQLLALYNKLHAEKRAMPTRLQMLVIKKKLIKTYKGSYHSGK